MDNGYEITKASDVITKLSHYRNNYHEKGMYLGWDKLHEHYSMQLGNVTDWTGYPMSGKTQVLMELLMNTSMWYGWRHLVYFPDVGSNVEIIADLIHKKTGKSFNPSVSNAISDDEIRKELDWITHHFLVLTKKDVKAKMTPMEFWDMAVEIKNREGLETASIDSWKDLSHPYDKYGGYSTYLEFVLPYRNHIAENNDLHLHTIIHPKLTEKENGKRKPPVPYDLKGGSEWFNSGKCMITVHREDLDSGIAEIYFNKIKPRAIGKIGKIDLRFDLNRFRYFDIEVEDTAFLQNHHKIFASQKDEPKQKEKMIYFSEPQTTLNHIVKDCPF
ncbi:hypothetical protein UFOVP425_12 [uncultured Caudovirales phage]|uniref:Uncharacterized protein n=1 Tax=uncultured Caudovirales phage TaxID=2100421 RepID=A0A6J5MAF1_9CAUD|nr:hypothetical protein UFOVP425_12 [uncultured Caudovirales phage]